MHRKISTSRDKIRLLRKRAVASAQHGAALGAQLMARAARLAAPAARRVAALLAVAVGALVALSSRLIAHAPRLGAALGRLIAPVGRLIAPLGRLMAPLGRLIAVGVDRSGVGAVARRASRFLAPKVIALRVAVARSPVTQHLKRVVTRVAMTPLAKLWPRTVVSRVATIGLAAAVLGAGLAAGIVTSGEPASSDSVALAEATLRQDAAQRADRSDRGTGAPVVEKSPPNRATQAPAAPRTAPPTPTTAPSPTAKAAAAPSTAAAKPKPAPPWAHPMPGAPLSSCYGQRWGTQHQGIDLAGNNGTPIRAVGAGTVAAAGWAFTGYGISVVIDHNNGYLSHYAHAQKALVKPGQTVKPGQPIALEGNTGDSTGPHLHFEIHQGMWNQVDPAQWLRSHGVAVGC